MDRHNPLKDLFVMRERINRIFENAHDQARCDATVGWVPVVDMYETPMMFVVKADLPEVRESAISVRVEGAMLVISGERQLQREGRQYHQVERCCGKFSRTFSLPDEVDLDGIEATLTDGILTVMLPKKAADTSRHIEIT